MVANILKTAAGAAIAALLLVGSAGSGLAQTALPATIQDAINALLDEAVSSSETDALEAGMIGLTGENPDLVKAIAETACGRVTSAPEAQSEALAAAVVTGATLGAPAAAADIRDVCVALLPQHAVAIEESITVALAESDVETAAGGGGVGLTGQIPGGNRSALSGGNGGSPTGGGGAL